MMPAGGAWSGRSGGRGPSASAVRMTVEQATHARQCCPGFALRELSPAELAALDAYCARALDDPDAEPQAGNEAAAVHGSYS